MAMRDHRIADIEIEMLLLALKQRWGYDFSGYARASLKRRLEALLDFFAVDSLSRILHDLLYDERVAQTVINAISVPTSDFFRDPWVWRQIREQLLPRLASFPLLNIWQVGCGHGQETYTLSLLLHEAGLLKKTRMIATDINSDFLEAAARGRWSSRNLPQWRENYRQAGGTADFDDYFQPQGAEIAIRATFQAGIEFIPHNLVSDDAFLETQLIVCRNVMIYFGDVLQNRVIEIFARSLQRGGYLLLGCAESLPERQADLAVFQKNIQLYQKPIWGGNV